MSEAIMQPVSITIPKDFDAIAERHPDNSIKRTIRVSFAVDFIRGNVCASPQFFGANLARRRIGTAIAKAFSGKSPGDKVTLPRALAWELWNAVSNLDYTGALAAQMPEEWLYAVPEIEPPPAAKEASDTEPPAAPKPDPNPPQEPSAADVAALKALGG